MTWERNGAGSVGSAVAPYTQQGNQIIKLHGARCVQIFITTFAGAKGRKQLDEVGEIHRAGAIEILGAVGTAGDFTHRPVPCVLTSDDPTIGVRQFEARAGGGHTAGAFRIRTIRAHAVGAVALEDAGGGGAIFGRCGFNTSAIVQTAGAFGEADRGAARGAGTRERAAYQSAIGGGQTQATTGGWDAARAARVAISLAAQSARALPRPAGVLTVVGRLGAAHS